jgi:hypothetical protein
MPLGQLADGLEHLADRVVEASVAVRGAAVQRRRLLRRPSPLPPHVDGATAGDSENPGSKPGAAAQRPQLLVRGHKRLLNGILGCVEVPEDSQSDPQHGPLVAPHEYPKGCSISTEHRLYQISVGLHVQVDSGLTTSSS